MYHLGHEGKEDLVLKNAVVRQSQIEQSAIDSSGTCTVVPIKYSPLLGSLPVCIYLGSLIRLFPLAVRMFQGCIFIQRPKIVYHYCHDSL